MLSSLEITGFRSLTSLRAEGLSRVNLLVGANNAGKTSFLEAVEALSYGTIAGLLRGPRRRGEVISAAADHDEVAVTHLFAGHVVAPGARLELAGDAGSGARLSAEIVDFHPDAQGPDSDGSSQGLALEVKSTPGPRRQLQELSPSAGVLVRSRASLRPSDFDADNIAFVRVGFWDPETSAGLWDEVVLTHEEETLVDALRTLEPSLEALAFTSGARRVGAWMKLRGVAEKVPLVSGGEGLSRFLALGLHLVATKGDVFLVDDIDTGLHHSAMEQLWKFVIHAARRLDCQVFATTHSLDCVQALARLLEDAGSNANVASVHRIERGRGKTVRFSVDEIAVAARHHLEVR